MMICLIKAYYDLYQERILTPSPNAARDQEMARRARAKTSSSMAGVRRPVKVFCWLG
jgi:hypothetical protein